MRGREVTRGREETRGVERKREAWIVPDGIFPAVV
jgi:hypothetical protein